MGGRTLPDPQRVWSKIVKGGEDDCWIFTGCTVDGGYGMVSYASKYWRVHRLIWTWEVGPIPDGLDVLHQCDNPPCCNPKHLFVGTHTDNMRDAAAKGRFHTEGEKNGRAKLTEKQVTEIRAIYAEGNETYESLAKTFKVSKANVKFIIQRRTWAHV